MVHHIFHFIIELRYTLIVLYFIEKNKVKKTYAIYRVNLFLFYYIVKNRVRLKYFYSKLIQTTCVHVYNLSLTRKISN